MRASWDPESHIHESLGAKPLAGGKTSFARQTKRDAGASKDRAQGTHNGGIDCLISAQKYVDSLADDALAAGAIDMSAIERIVEESESFEDLQARLAEVYRGIGMDQFRHVLAEAMVRADLKGRSFT